MIKQKMQLKLLENLTLYLDIKDICKGMQPSIYPDREIDCNIAANWHCALHCSLLQQPHSCILLSIISQKVDAAADL